MKSTRLVLIVLLLSLLAGASYQTAKAESFTWPECGTVTITTTTNYDAGSLRVSSPWVVAPFLTLNSSAGWEIKMVTVTYISPSGDTLQQVYTFPSGTTRKDIRVDAGISIVQAKVVVVKPCADGSQTRCRPTGEYVYTLLGNYPCILVSAEHPIPERFLNPVYTTSLCSLPNLAHDWNGKWNVSMLKDCGDYLVGGNHFDTRLEQ